MEKLFNIIIFFISITLIISNGKDNKNENQYEDNHYENQNNINDNSKAFNLSQEIEKLYYDNMNNTEKWQYIDDPMDHNETFYNEIEEINEPKETEEEIINRLTEKRIIDEWEMQVKNFKPEELLTLKLDYYKRFVNDYYYI
jgi:hypothetical protein